MKLKNKVITTLAVFTLALTGGTLAAGFSAPAHASQGTNRDVSAGFYLYAVPYLGMHTNGQGNPVDVTQSNYTFILHQVTTAPTGYYTIRTTNGHLLFENKTGGVEEGAVRDPNQPSTGELWIKGDQQNGAVFFDNAHYGGTMGAWGTPPGGPPSGTNLRVRSTHTGFYAGWNLFPEKKH